MALRDKLAARVQPLLEPGEQVQAVFVTQTGPSPYWVLLTTLIFFTVKRRIIVATDRADRRRPRRHDVGHNRQRGPGSPAPGHAVRSRQRHVVEDRGERRAAVGPQALPRRRGRGRRGRGWRSTAAAVRGCAAASAARRLTPTPTEAVPPPSREGGGVAFGGSSPWRLHYDASGNLRASVVHASWGTRPRDGKRAAHAVDRRRRVRGGRPVPRQQRGARPARRGRRRQHGAAVRRRRGHGAVRAHRPALAGRRTLLALADGGRDGRLDRGPGVLVVVPDRVGHAPAVALDGRRRLPDPARLRPARPAHVRRRPDPRRLAEPRSTTASSSCSTAPSWSAPCSS